MSRDELPLPGELINVKGRKVHVQRDGIGSPTVVFESALFGNSLSFARVQPEISKITGTLSYDRGGLFRLTIITLRILAENRAILVQKMLDNQR